MPIWMSKLARAAALTLIAAAQSAPVWGKAPAADFTHGATFTPNAVSMFDIVSKNTGRTYRIWVSKPSAPPPATGYGVFYLTDGNPQFRLVADQMAVRQYLGLKPALIVGVGYPSDDLWTVTRLRSRDLIPFPINPGFEPTWKAWSTFGGATNDDAGGGEAFYRFLTDELRPRINGLAPIDQADQALYGHSLGGLFTLYTLLNHPEAFRTYAISSPSIIVNSGEILNAIPAFGANIEQKRLRPRVILLVGGKETVSASDLAKLPPPLAISYGAFPELESVAKLADRLRGVGALGKGDVQVQVFEGEDHLSVVPASLSRALTFAFSPPPGKP
jgi:predicted alpha/beta superfamily hydrolase